MNTDIRVHVTFPKHMKTKKLGRRLGADGVLCLLNLWIYAAENRPSGVLTGMDEDDIEIAADWSGEPGAFLRAVQAVNFLGLDGDNFCLHNWETRNPWAAAAEERSRTNSENAKKGWEKRRQKQGLDATRMQTALRPVESRNGPLLSSPSLTLPEEPLSSSNSSEEDIQGAADQGGIEEEEWREVASLHHQAFGRLLSGAEFGTLQQFSIEAVKTKYTQALERKGSDDEVRSWSWIERGLREGLDGKRDGKGWSFFKRKGKIAGSFV